MKVVHILNPKHIVEFKTLQINFISIKNTLFGKIAQVC